MANKKIKANLLDASQIEKTLVRLDSNRETIVIMMRYGGAMDQIARELGYYEQELVEEILLP